jgi:peptidyl-tRNA hydrolase
MDETSGQVSAHEDPEGEAPWAMQLIVHVEKGTPPGRHATCAAACKAVVSLLDDERASEGGPWKPAVDRWLAGRIRKHTRRARGAKWVRVEELAGVTACVDGAEVRALVPSATDDVDATVARLQLSGLELADDTSDTGQGSASTVVTVTLSAAPQLTSGKAVAAAAHAAQLAYMNMPDDVRDTWRETRWAVTATDACDETAWDTVRASAPVVVVDAGFTEVETGTTTSVAAWTTAD